MELREQLSDARTRRSFAEEQLPLPVKEILDDVSFRAFTNDYKLFQYLRLQRLVRDSDDKVAKYDNLEKECTKLQKENQRLIKTMDDTVQRYEVQLQMVSLSLFSTTK